MMYGLPNGWNNIEEYLYLANASNVLKCSSFFNYRVDSIVSKLL